MQLKKFYSKHSQLQSALSSEQEKSAREEKEVEADPSKGSSRRYSSTATAGGAWSQLRQPQRKCEAEGVRECGPSWYTDQQRITEVRP